MTLKEVELDQILAVEDSFEAQVLEKLELLADQLAELNEKVNELALTANSGFEIER